jgi:hypothetical protein
MTHSTRPSSPVEAAAIPTEHLETLARSWQTLTLEERQGRLDAARGLFGGGSRSVADFLREKHDELDREEREWERRQLEREPASEQGDVAPHSAP